MQTKHLLTVLALALGLPGSGASAHSEGHGPAIAGKGPNGGKLVAVISALEAEAGPKAKPVALAEWMKVGADGIRVTLLDLKKAPLTLPGSTEQKWILLGAAKPIVETKQHKEPQSQLFRVFTQDELKSTESVEVILPYFETAGLAPSELEKKPKRVLSFRLKN